ncbi:MAG: integrase [Burkholderiales bacterium]|nr:integrase [Burkholderiales bacterium]
MNLSKVEARTRLAPRRDPYWQRLEAGCFLGYRKMTAGSAGTWLARSRDASTGKQLHSPLGELSEHPAHARFDVASKAAREWFAHLGRGGKARQINVKTACANYVKHLAGAGKLQAARDTEKRFARWVNDHKIGAISLQKLKPGDIDTWRRELASTPATPQDKRRAPTRPRAASTLNRDMTSLRAALNLAVENGDATSDAAWKIKLRPVKDADRRRDVYLDLNQRRALIAKAPTDLAAFLRALSLVPLRPGAVAALVAGSFDKRLSTLTIGKDKHGQDRKIKLPSATASFFAEHCKDKLPTAPLFARADGSAWNKDAWKYPFKDAAITAGLSAAATAYALRHSTITDLIALHRLDTLTVAQLSGTSLLMIEKHYGHLLREHAANALASLTL